MIEAQQVPAARPAWFSALAPVARQAFESHATTLTFSPRQVVVKQGDIADRVFLIQQGRVKAKVGGPEGHDAALEVLGPGQMFGEVALLDDVPRYGTTVTGMDKGELLVVPRDDFRALLNEYPQESMELLTAMTRRVHHLSERVESSSLGLPRRLARVLMLLLAELSAPVDLDLAADAMRTPGRDPLNVSQQDLGEFVGAARESVNRQLKSWQRQGIVDLRRGRVVIVDPGALTTIGKRV